MSTDDIAEQDRTHWNDFSLRSNEMDGTTDFCQHSASFMQTLLFEKVGSTSRLIFLDNRYSWIFQKCKPQVSLSMQMDFKLLYLIIAALFSNLEQKITTIKGLQLMNQNWLKKSKLKSGLVILFQINFDIPSTEIQAWKWFFKYQISHHKGKFFNFLNFWELLRRSEWMNTIVEKNPIRRY